MFERCLCGGSGLLTARRLDGGISYRYLFKCPCGVCSYNYPVWSDTYRLTGYVLNGEDLPGKTYIEVTQQKEREVDSDESRLIQEMFGAELIMRTDNGFTDGERPKADGHPSERLSGIRGPVNGDDYQCFGIDGGESESSS